MRPVVVIAIGALILAACNPAIARRRGQVVSVRSDKPETEVCIANAVDAGSTYGDKTPSDRECLRGILDGQMPELGDCVTLQVQGEGSELRVTSADDC